MSAHLRRHLEPLFVQAKVDVVLWGHEHAYERMHAVVNGSVVSRSTRTPPHAPINLVLGMGGADNSCALESTPPPPSPPSMRRRHLRSRSLCAPPHTSCHAVCLTRWR
jgi:hypothetical protein